MASMQKLSGPAGATFEVVDTDGTCTIELDGSALVSVAGTDLSTLTASAAELNIMDGVGATTAEINMAADSSANTEVVVADNVLTAAESGKTFILNAITAILTTLPAVAAGLRFNFYVGALGVANAQNHIIRTNAANDNTIFGGAIVAGSEVAASAEGDINIVGTSGTTALPGDFVSVFCDGTNWYANGRATTAGAITFTT